MHPLFLLSPKDWIDAVKQERFKSYTWSAPVKIPITTLDKLIEKYGKPHFIKIDVEGYELEVLKGLTQAINWISFEYTVPEQTQKAIDCILQIQKFNPNIQCNYSIEEKHGICVVILVACGCIYTAFINTRIYDYRFWRYLYPNNLVTFIAFIS